MSNYIPILTYDGNVLSINHLKKLKIVKHMNRHARAYFTGTLNGEEKDALLDKVQSESLLEIGYYDADVYTSRENNIKIVPLFTGTINKLSVRAAQNEYTVTVSAVSLTYQLDIKPRSRSFQNQQMTYDDLIQSVLDNYRKDTKPTRYPDVQWTSNLKGQRLEKFALQYNETDWAFLKRMASRLDWGLISGAKKKKPHVHFGLPEEDAIDGKMEAYNYTVTRKLGFFNEQGEGGNLLYHKVRTTEMKAFFAPGEKITLKLYVLSHPDTSSNRYTNRYSGQPKPAGYTEKELDLYVYQSVTSFETDWTHDCVLTDKSGLLQKRATNKQIQGVSLRGRVIEVKEDQVKVHFEEIDGTNKPALDKALCFPQATMYTSEGNTGWYCMPEIDDYVNIYFPTDDEKDGMVTHSVRMRTNGGDMIADPAVKIFMTKYRKAIIFEKNEIIITGNDNEMLIRLIDESGIEIRSNKDIRVNADRDLILNAGNTVQITAKEAIGLTSKTSLIEMDGETRIRGTKVKMN
jgi:hypothetical protein